MTGIEWMHSYMKRHFKLSYKKVENMSIARISGFNGTNVEMFFKNYSEVMAKYKFSRDRIVNTDETCVMQAPKTGGFLESTGPMLIVRPKLRRNNGKIQVFSSYASPKNW